MEIEKYDSLMFILLPELWNIIFSYSSPFKRRNMMTVSKNWCQLLSPMIFQINMRWQSHYYISSHFTNLKELIVRGYNFKSVFHFKMLIRLPNLTSLSLSNLVHKRYMFRFLSQLTNLQKIKLKSIKLNRRRMLWGIEKIKSLQSFSIKYCQYGSGYYDNINACTNLTNLNGTFAWNELRFVSDLVNLQKLTISGKHFVTERLHIFTNLQCLTIRYCLELDQNFDFLSRLTKLQQFNLKLHKLNEKIYDLSNFTNLNIKITFSKISSISSEDISPLSGLTNLRFIYQGSFKRLII